MSGISGSDLKKRIVRIMTQRAANKLTLGRKLLLAAAGVAALAGPVFFGLMNAPQSRAQSSAPASAPTRTFDVVSIKPNHDSGGHFRFGNDPGRLVAENVTLKFLLQIAYRVKDAQILGAPAWTSSDRYNIEAKSDDSSADMLRKLSDDEQETQARLMLQSMLADRFKLALHHEMKELPVYVLVVAKNGPKFHESADTPDAPAPSGPPAPNEPQRRHTLRMNGPGNVSAIAQNLDIFADVLSHQLGRPVLNKTGLKGDYDFTLKWTPDEGRAQMPGGPPGEATPSADANGPSIFTALQEQLGLKLELQKGPMDTIVIDHVDRPSEN